MVLGALPGWLVAGVALGAVAAMGALIVFAVGTRRYGTPPTGGVSDPHAPRRAEVRAYLVGLGEVFTERETIAGHAVDFWLPHRGVAVTFDASAYLALSSSGYRAVLLEHELP
ncbi:MAG: molecular chaperone DnaJ, partial [Halobacteriales archaeon]